MIMSNFMFTGRRILLANISFWYRNCVEHKPSYWHCPGTKPLSALTLGQVADIAAERWGDKEALKSVYQGHSFTFRQIRDKVTCSVMRVIKLLFRNCIFLVIIAAVAKTGSVISSFP